MFSSPFGFCNEVLITYASMITPTIILVLRTWDSLYIKSTRLKPQRIHIIKAICQYDGHLSSEASFQ